MNNRRRISDRLEELEQAPGPEQDHESDCESESENENVNGQEAMPYAIASRNARLLVEQRYTQISRTNAVIFYMSLMRTVNMGLHTGSITTTVLYFVGRISIDEIANAHPEPYVPMSHRMFDTVGTQNLELIRDRRASNATLFGNENRMLSQDRNDAHDSGHHRLYNINNAGVVGTNLGTIAGTAIDLAHDHPIATGVLLGVVGTFAVQRMVSSDQIPESSLRCQIL